jgi:hypothetical protein
MHALVSKQRCNGKLVCPQWFLGRIIAVLMLSLMSAFVTAQTAQGDHRTDPHREERRHFTWKYTFDPVGQQRRDWVQTSPSTWDEIYENGNVTHFKLLQPRESVDGIPGSAVINEANLVVFIPDATAAGLRNGRWLRFRTFGAVSTDWAWLAEISEVPQSSSASMQTVQASQVPAGSRTSLSGSTKEIYEKAVSLLGQVTWTGHEVVAKPGTAAAFLELIRRDPNGSYGLWARKTLNDLVSGKTVFPDWDGKTGLDSTTQSAKALHTSSQGGDSDSTTDYDEQLKNAMVLWKNSQVSETIKAVAALIKADPNRWEGYGLAGVIERAQNKLPEARAAYQRALDLAPDAVKPQLMQAIQGIEAQGKH